MSDRDLISRRWEQRVKALRYLIGVVRRCEATMLDLYRPNCPQSPAWWAATREREAAHVRVTGLRKWFGVPHGSHEEALLRVLQHPASASLSDEASDAVSQGSFWG